MKANLLRWHVRCFHSSSFCVKGKWQRTIFCIDSALRLSWWTLSARRSEENPFSPVSVFVLSLYLIGYDWRWCLDVHLGSREFFRGGGGEIFRQRTQNSEPLVKVMSYPMSKVVSPFLSWYSHPLWRRALPWCNASTATVRNETKWVCISLPTRVVF